jgi:hypothetical protein
MVYFLRSSQEIGYSSLKPNPDVMVHLEALRDEAQGGPSLSHPFFFLRFFFMYFAVDRVWRKNIEQL